eukprot:6490362-Amphidinium_carterae.2
MAPSTPALSRCRPKPAAKATSTCKHAMATKRAYSSKGSGSTQITPPVGAAVKAEQAEADSGNEEAARADLSAQFAAASVPVGAAPDAPLLEHEFEP